MFTPTSLEKYMDLNRRVSNAPSFDALWDIVDEVERRVQVMILCDGSASVPRHSPPPPDQSPSRLAHEGGLPGERSRGRGHFGINGDRLLLVSGVRERSHYECVRNELYMTVYVYFICFFFLERNGSWPSEMTNRHVIFIASQYITLRINNQSTMIWTFISDNFYSYFLIFLVGGNTSSCAGASFISTSFCPSCSLALSSSFSLYRFLFADTISLSVLCRDEKQRLLCWILRTCTLSSRRD
jgi:hypothetical protein